MVSLDIEIPALSEQANGPLSPFGGQMRCFGVFRGLYNRWNDRRDIDRHDRLPKLFDAPSAP